MVPLPPPSVLMYTKYILNTSIVFLSFSFYLYDEPKEMEDDASEWTPGRKGFWVEFYDAEDGRLQSMQQEMRNATELTEGPSLMDHFEWFMLYEVYEDHLVQCLAEVFPTPGCAELRVLHIGCGNSDFCDQIEFALQRVYLKTKSPPRAAVLNVDVCSNIVQHLCGRYPERLYAVGSCCDLGVCNDVTDDAVWYALERPGDGGPPALIGVRDGAVDLVFDKGTMDALLSAFCDGYNPNATAYADEALRVLKPHGVLFIISINSEEILNQYILGSEVDGSSFQLKYRSVIELSKKSMGEVRVEKLGSRYTCYGYVRMDS